MQTVIENQGKIDTETLMRLARDKSVGSRTKLADIIGDLFFGATGTLSDAEQSIMTDILRQLVQDVEINVRKHLAIQLSNQSDAPHDLVLALANDDSEVAYPLLLKSRVLRDQDLVAIIHHRTLEHQLAVSMRDSVSPVVSAALVETGEETVIKRLLENHNAEIACDTMAHVVEQSRRLDSLQKPLVHRSDLPAELAEKMYWWVSAALRSHIVENFDVDQSDIDSAMEVAVKTVIATQETEDSDMSATDRVARYLAESHDTDGDLIIRLLRDGEVTLFERVLAPQTGLRRFEDHFFAHGLVVDVDLRDHVGNIADLRRDVDDLAGDDVDGLLVIDQRPRLRVAHLEHLRRRRLGRSQVRVKPLGQRPGRDKSVAPHDRRTRDRGGDDDKRRPSDPDPRTRLLRYRGQVRTRRYGPRLRGRDRQVDTLGHVGGRGFGPGVSAAGAPHHPTQIAEHGRVDEVARRA